MDSLDKAIASTLVNQADQILGLFEGLNILHTRGRLDRDEVRKTLASGQAVILEWIDALGW